MEPTHNKKIIRRTLYIGTIVVLLAVIAGLGYYAYSAQQQLDALEQQQASSQKKLMDRVAILEKNNKDLLAAADTSTPAQTETVAVDDTTAIIAAATQFADSNGIAYTAPLQVADRYGDFAEVRATSAGLVLKKASDSWTVVSHGQQLNLDDARTHGIPIDATSPLYQSLTPEERQGIITR